MFLRSRICRSAVSEVASARPVYSAQPTLRRKTFGVMANHRLLPNQDGDASRSDRWVEHGFDRDLRPNACDITQRNSNARFFSGHGFPLRMKNKKKMNREDAKSAKER